MIISHYHKFIFVKTRKTAGSTFEKLVLPYLGKTDLCTGSLRDETPALNMAINQNGHISLADIMRKYFPDGCDYNIITLERNPYDKVVSSYYWHQNIKEQQFGNMDFETYMKTCNLLPQDWSLYTLNGKLPTTLRVFHYESMHELYLWLKEHRGIHITLDKVGDTKLKSGIRKVKDYKELHTDTTRQITENLFSEEIQEFSYEF